MYQNNTVINSPIGKLEIKFSGEKLSGIHFLDHNLNNIVGSNLFDQENRTIKNIITQLQQYFVNPNITFNIPFDLIGTAFQKRVWNELLSIPVGATKTYGDLAKKLNSSARAVGTACKKNPIPIVIPCHRVIARDHIGGFAGKTSGNAIEIKQWLLTHEMGKWIIHSSSKDL